MRSHAEDLVAVALLGDCHVDERKVGELRIWVPALLRVHDRAGRRPDLLGAVRAFLRAVGEGDPHHRGLGGGRARLKLNDRELELTNLLGLVLGCIEAKFCK